MPLVPDEVPVRRVRELLDEPDPTGLSRPVQDLLVRAWALRTGRGFFLHGTAIDASGRADLPDEVVLRKEPLPTEEEWKAALRRAGSLFGIAPHSNVRTAGNVTSLAGSLREAAETHAPACRRLLEALADARDRMRIGGELPRLRQAEAAREVLAALRREVKPAVVVRELAGLPAQDPDETLGRTLRSADEVAHALVGADWAVFEACWALADERREGARRNREAVEAVVRQGELAQPLAQELRRLRDEALRIVVTKQPVDPPVVDPPPGEKRTVAQGSMETLQADEAIAALERIRSLLEGHPDRHLTLSWTVTEPDGEDPTS